MNIIIGADGSEHAADALQKVLSRAWIDDANFRVITVATLGKLSQSEATAVNKGAFEMLERKFGARRVTAEVLEGDAGRTLLQASELWPADLLVVGSHRYTGLKRIVFGSVTDFVVDKAQSSVLVVRGQSLEAINGENTEATRVLVCLNRDRNCRNVLEHVAKQSWMSGTRILVANVFEPPTGDFSPSPKRELQLFQEAEGAIGVKLREFVDECVGFLRIQLPDLEVSGTVREELDVCEDLISLSQQWNSDLIVIGAPTHHGPFAESVCKCLVVQAPCSVEVVRARASS